MKEIYVLSGLGADKRVFKFIDFGEHDVTFIKWIPPLANESIEEYAKRLLPQINSVNPTLIGLSFGGMMAVEISKQIETTKVILISSAKTKSDVPFYFRWIGLFGFHKIVPAQLTNKSNWLAQWFFGAQTEIEKDMLKDILKETDPIFLKWAIDKIVSWKNNSSPKNLTHIHGSADKLLPMTTCDFQIKGGSHLMILNKAEQVSSLLQRILG